MSLLRLISVLTLALALGAGQAASAQDAPVFNDSQRRAIEAVVKDYLVNNPDVLQEAIAEGERRQQETLKLAQAAALKESRETLLNSTHNVFAGNPNGDITIVEFFDYNCGYCKKALGDLQVLVKNDPKLRIALKDLPVLGADSLEASKLGLAAKLQIKPEKMFDFHARLLESKGRINAERAIAVAREFGVDAEKLKKDAQGPEVKAALAENDGLAEKLGLSGTPAFIIGDEILPGAVGVDRMSRTVADVRKCGRASC